MRTIALEEHFVTPAFMDGPGRKFKERVERTGGRLAHLLATWATAASPRWTQRAWTCRLCRWRRPALNSSKAKRQKRSRETRIPRWREAVRRHPTRFFGLASLPTGDPPAAIAELERAAGDHGFKRLVINGHHRGRYLDDRFFWPILARAPRR